VSVAFRPALALLVAAWPLVAAPARPARAAPRGHPVEIRAFQFAPATLTVRVGDTLAWTNHDMVPHTVAAPGSWDSGSIAANATWRYTASRAGRFDYACAFHPGMKATLVVR
jgi:plastocyanin